MPSYYPEQSTSIFIPITAQNLITGLWSWASLSAALLATGSGSLLTTSGSGNSSMLTCTGWPAGVLDDISIGAQINRFRFVQQARLTRTGIYQPESELFLMKNGVAQGAGQNITIATSPSWGTDTTDIIPSPLLTGSQLKTGLYGPGYRTEQTDPNVAGTNEIRAVTIQIFYQNPIPEGGGGVTFSEA